MESSTRFSQAPHPPSPSNRVSPHFTIEPLPSVASPIFSLKNSKPLSKNTQYFNRSWQASSHVIFPLQTKFPFWSRIPLLPHTHTHTHWNTSLKVHAVSIDPDVPPLNGIRALTDLFIKNFLFRWSPHFFLFEPPNKNPPKRLTQFQRSPTLPPYPETSPGDT